MWLIYIQGFVNTRELVYLEMLVARPLKYKGKAHPTANFFSSEDKSVPLQHIQQ